MKNKIINTFFQCDAAFTILRMGRSSLQEAKNSMQKHMPILENCKGKVLGVSKEVTQFAYLVGNFFNSPDFSLQPHGQVFQHGFTETDF